MYCINRWHISMLFLRWVAWEISDELICEGLENVHFYSQKAELAEVLPHRDTRAMKRVTFIHWGLHVLINKQPGTLTTFEKENQT